MARTARTAERLASDPASVPSSDRSSSNDRSSDAKSDYQQKNSMSNVRNNGSAAVVATLAAAATATQPVATATSRTVVDDDDDDDDPNLGKSYENSARASGSTVARKLSPGRDNNNGPLLPPPLPRAGHYRDRRRENGHHTASYGHGSYRSRGRDGWSDSRGRGGRANEQSFDRDGGPHSRPYWGPPNSAANQHRDTSFSRGHFSGREYELSPGNYQHRPHDDGRWGRDRDWNGDYDLPYHHHHHHRRPNSNYFDDHRPRERQAESKFNEGKETRKNSSSSYKRRKRGHQHDHDKYNNNNDGRTQDPIGRYRSDLSYQPREQPSNNKDVRALSLKLARLKKEIEDLKEEKRESASRPSAPSNSGAQSETVGVNLDTVVPVGSPVNAVQQREIAPGDVGIADSPIEFSPDAEEQARTAPPRATSVATSTSQTRNVKTSNNCNESCYDVSTDEEIDSFQPGAFANRKGIKREEVESNDREPDESANNQSTNTAVAYREDVKQETAESNEHGPEENANEQSTNLTFENREEVKREVTEDNEHGSEENANNQSTHIAFADREEVKREEAEINDLEPEENESNQSTHIVIADRQEVKREEAESNKHDPEENANTQLTHVAIAGREEAESNEHEPEENEENQSTQTAIANREVIKRDDAERIDHEPEQYTNNHSNNIAIAHREEVKREEVNSNDHGPEENKSHQFINVTDADREEDEIEESQSNDREPEGSANNYSTTIAFADREEVESEGAEINDLEPEENPNKQSTTISIADREEDEIEEAMNNDHEPEAKANNQSTNITFTDREEDEMEKAESNGHEPEANANNNSTNIAIADRKEDEIEEAEVNDHKPEENANKQSTIIANDNINDDADSDQDSVDLVLKDYYDPYGKISYCCQNCRCWKTSRKKYFLIRNNCGNSGGGLKPGNTNLYHKGCCHGDKKCDEDYLSPMTKAIEKSFMMGERTDSVSRLDTYANIKKACLTANREEAKFENEEFNEASDSCIYGSVAYEKCCKNFQHFQKDQRRPLRVLDLFSGIGSGVVVLKRLKLPIHTIVHVEHDPVAVEVCKANHRDDGITHHYVTTFEEVFGTNYEPNHEIVVALVEKYGTFDLVLAGSPCQNYSGLNASRDPNSENAQYLLKVGRLIQKLDEIQLGSKNVKDNVLFLSENVVFKDHGKADQCYGGLPPVRLDAKDFSPCKRNRFYWTNVRLRSSAKIKDVASGVSLDGFLDEGYGAVARLIQAEDQEDMPVKSNSFLASLARIDDDRMIKYKLAGTPGRNASAAYHIETYSVAEREKMIGLPAGYVEKPVGRLFSELTQKAFILPESSDKGETYRDFLPREFWHFRKKCNFKFLANSELPYFQLALSSPLEGKSQLAFYSEKQYCKRLIGNGWSIPVVEYLLGSLTELFASDVLLTYDKYNTPYPWPYISP